MIDKVDEYFGHVFDMPKLSAASKDNEENKAKRREKNLAMVKNEKIAIQNHIWFELLSISSLDHIPISTNFMQSGQVSVLTIDTFPWV